MKHIPAADQGARGGAFAEAKRNAHTHSADGTRTFRAALARQWFTAQNSAIEARNAREYRASKRAMTRIRRTT